MFMVIVSVGFAINQWQWGDDVSPRQVLSNLEEEPARFPCPARKNNMPFL
jgi:hypothetical protein